MTSGAPHPLSRHGLLGRMAPFGLLTALGFAAAALPATRTEPAALVAAAIVTVLIVAAISVVPWHRLPSWTQVLPILSFLLVVLLLRQSRGGASSGYAPLAILPVVWLALHATRAQTLAAAAGVGLSFFAPIVLLDYPIEELRRALLWSATAPLIGLAIHGAVTSLRSARGDAERAERAQQAAAERASAAELKFERAFVSSPVGLGFFDMQGGFERVNPALERMLGRSLSQLGEETIGTLCHPDDRSACDAVVPRLLDGELGVGLRKRWLLPDGGETITQAHAALLRDDHGQPIGLFCQYQDVTATEQAERGLRETSALIDAVLENANAVIYAKDLDGRLLLANRQYGHTTGLHVPDALGRDDVSLFGEAGRAFRASDLRVLGAGTPVSEEERLPGPDGDQIFASTKFPLTDGDGRVIGTGGVSLDITAARHAEQAVRVAEERFRGAFDGAPIGMALIGPDGQVERANDAMATLCGRVRGALDGVSLREIVDPADLDRGAAALRSLVAGATDRLAIELSVLHPSGTPRTVSVSGTVVHDSAGRVTHMLGQFQDVTERNRVAEQLQHMADHDPLTGLLNRRRFATELERHVARVTRYGPEGAVIVLDIDEFKSVNDTLGHAAGDELIIAIGQILRERLRASDTLARLGGDEFAILLPTAGEAEAARVARSLVLAIRAYNPLLDGVARQVTTSVGIAMCDSSVDDLSAGTVVIAADLAMYAAKQAGRDQYVLHVGREPGASRTTGAAETRAAVSA